MADATLDVGPENCGHRLLSRVADVIAQLMPSQTLAVVTYDPSSELDLKIWCQSMGYQVLSATEAADHLVFLIEKTIGNSSCSAWSSLQA
jgi:TusA-related sulfurtransferase